MKMAFRMVVCVLVLAIV